MAGEFLSLGPCSPPTLSTCLGQFTATLPSGTKAVIVAGIEAANKQVQALGAKAASAASSASGAVDAIQAKVDKIDKEIAGVQAALTPIDEFLAKIPCPELLALKGILEASKATLEAAKGAVDLTGLSSGINAAIAQRNTFNSIESCLNGYKDVLA